MAARLTAQELDHLHTAVQKVLREAIRAGGSSVSDYVDAAGERGFFQLRHYVYMRTGQPCLVCRTPIRRIVIAGRGTHYCPVCQR
jgi:formamidopyrimidine-DNA glycosylase